MTTVSKRMLWVLTIGAFFAFFVFGFSDNLKGPVLPALLEDLKFSYSLGGTVLLGAYLGFMAATLSTGFLADVFGQKAVLLLAGLCLALGVVGLNLFRAPAALMLALGLLGFGLGSLELGCNALIVSLHSADKARYLNLMAVMHGLGSMLAPLYAGWLLAANVSWRLVYRWDLLLIGLLLVYFLLARFPSRAAGQAEKIDFQRLGRTAFVPQMLWFYAAITLYVAIELGLAAWMVEFLQKARGQSVAQSTQALALFFGLIMAGRFVGSFFVEKLGYLRSILGMALAASACVALGLFGPPELAFCFSLSGFFLSIIFPTLTAAVSDAHPAHLNSILGLLFTFAGLGGVLGPWLVGLVSDWGGLSLGFGLNLGFGLLTALAALVLLFSQTSSTSSAG